VRKIPGIGKVTEASLVSLGINTVGQLQEVSLERLEANFGRWGTALYRKARGIDACEIFIDAEPKSISHNQTFGRDTNASETLHATLSYLGQKVGKRLRDAGLQARTVTLTLRFADFRTITRNHTLVEASDLDSELLGATRALFEKAWNGRAMVRLVGVALSSFSSSLAGPEQLDLLDPARREKLERLARATDRLRDRYGFSKVQLAGSLEKPAKGAKPRSGDGVRKP
jgi:DNA polymerase-4